MTFTKSVSIGKIYWFYWLQPRKKTAGNGFGVSVGKGGTSRKNPDHMLTFPDFPASLPLPGRLTPEHGSFSPVHSPASLSSGVPGNLPLSHRGPFQVRALGPLSVPETKIIPLWRPSHLERMLPHRLCSKP